MIEEIKLLLGDAATNYNDAQLGLAYRIAAAEVETYCGRDLDSVLELMAARIAVINLNKSGAEGMAAQGFSGVSESYLDGYPADIQAILNRKRKLKVM